MLRRGGLILFLIAWLGIAAILAADTLGITWPWQQQTAEAPPVPGAQPGKQETPAAGKSPLPRGKYAIELRLGSLGGTKLVPVEVR